MKCTLFVYHNETNDIKDRKLVNTIERELRRNGFKQQYKNEDGQLCLR